MKKPSVFEAVGKRLCKGLRAELGHRSGPGAENYMHLEALACFQAASC